MATNYTAFSVETPSLGTNTTPWGIFLKNPRSYKAIWLGPSSPMLQPECEPTSLIGFLPIPAILIWSAALLKNAAKVEQNGILFLQASPVVTPTKFCSAIKHYIKLYGNFSINVIANVEFFVSPSNPTTLLFDYLAFLRATP